MRAKVLFSHHWLWSVVLSGTCLLSQSSAEAATRWAMLVGIDEYGDSQSLPTLKFASKDVHAVADALVETGFAQDKVVLVDSRSQSATRRGIQKELDDLLKHKVQPGDTVLLVFSMHGVNSGGASYLCPADARVDAPRESMLSVSKLHEELANCPAAQKYLVIDACRNEISGNEIEKLNLFSSLRKLTATHDGPQGIVVMASCMSGQKSIEDPELEHGLFIHFFTEGLRGAAEFTANGNRDGKLSPFELFKFAAQHTSDWSRKFGWQQTPWLEGHSTHDVSLAEFSEERMQTLSEKHRQPDRELTSAQLHSMHEVSEATLALRNGNVEDVLQHCNQAIEYDSKNKLAYRTRALAYQLMNQYDKAIEDQERIGEPLLVSVHEQPVTISTNKGPIGTANAGDSLEVRSKTELGNEQWLEVTAIHRKTPGELPKRDPLNGWVKSQTVIAGSNPVAQVRKFQADNQQPGYLAQGAYGNRGQSEGLKRAADIHRSLPVSYPGKGWIDYGLGIGGRRR